MAFKTAPRARQTCTAPGTGAMVVSGTVEGAQTFASYLSNGDTTWITATNNTAWAEGNATYASGANSLTFIVDSDFRSSNGNALVNFSSGSVDVFCDLISLRAKVLERLLWATAAITPPTSGGTALGTGSLPFSSLFLSGLLDLSASGAGQIAFPATQNPSAGANTLDDYEEGTWTPSVGGSATYTVQTGVYTKIGRAVLLSGHITINAIGTGSTGSISGVPFSAATATAGSVGYFAGAAANLVYISAYVIGTSVNITTMAAAGTTMSTPGNFFANGADIIFEVPYYV